MRMVPPEGSEGVQLLINPTMVARFEEFADQSAEFARRIVEQSDGRATARMDHALLNLRIARTVFSKWSVEILTFLYIERAARFQEIRKALGDISARVLSLKLAGLETLGFVHRTVLDTRPPGVEYSLTEKGLHVAKLGEPVFLYLRMTEGLLSPTRP
jgi:DNA-binding HxlR family transcriptional regulator